MWYYFFLLGTQLGEEPFCAFFFSFWFWNIDASIGRQLVLVWNLVMYLGQVLKDVIQIERPRMPVVVQLQAKWAEEYGLPSTHAMMGLAVPSATFYLTVGKYSFPEEAAVIITGVWVLLVSTSRMFLGMHSLADILAGLLLSSALLPPILYLAMISDQFLVQSPLAPFLCLIASILALVLFPSTASHHWSPSATTSVDVLGCYQGVQLGQWCLFRLGIVNILHSSSLGKAEAPHLTPGLVLARILTGALVAVVVMITVKSTTRYLTKYASNPRGKQNIIICSKVTLYFILHNSVILNKKHIFSLLHGSLSVSPSCLFLHFSSYFWEYKESLFIQNIIRENKDSQQSVSCLIHISFMFISAGSMVALAVSVLVRPHGLSLAHWDIGWW